MISSRHVHTRVFHFFLICFSAAKPKIAYIAPLTVACNIKTFIQYKKRSRRKLGSEHEVKVVQAGRRSGCPSLPPLQKQKLVKHVSATTPVRYTLYHCTRGSAADSYSSGTAVYILTKAHIRGPHTLPLECKSAADCLVQW